VQVGLKGFPTNPVALYLSLCGLWLTAILGFAKLAMAVPSLLVKLPILLGLAPLLLIITWQSFRNRNQDSDAKHLNLRSCIRKTAFITAILWLTISLA